MKSNSVVIIGHKDITNLNEIHVETQIENLIQQGYTCFLCGGMGQFDNLCAKIISSKKHIYPDIRCYLIIPYLTVSLPTNNYYDEIIFPEGFEKYYYKEAILKRNKYMVDNASLALCYICYNFGGAVKTYAYARKKGLKIINTGTL